MGVVVDMTKGRVVEAAAPISGTERTDGGDDRPPVYTDPDGTIVYRASSLGSCVRSLVAHRNQVASPRPHSDDMMARFAAGIIAEPRIIEYLGTQGWDVIDAGDSQVEYDLPVLPGVVVRCHPDGLAARAGEPRYTTERVVECKALADSLAHKGLYALSHYPWQLAVEMLATDRKALYVVYNKGYEDIDERSVVIKEIDDPPHTLAEVKARIAKVEVAARAADLPDCNQRDYPCQWYGVVCQHVGGLDAATAETDDSIEALCARMLAAREATKAAKAHEDEARELLLTALGDRQRVQAGSYLAVRSAYEQTRFDTRRFQAEHPDVWELYRTVTTSTRLDVKTVE